jgi:hypothetical protein
MRKFISFFLVSGFLCLSPASAFDDAVTHKELIFNAAEVSTLDGYSKDKLGLPQGIFTDLGPNSHGKPTHEKDNRIIEWLREGAFIEDNPICRATNHFHNPLRDWS